MPTKHDDVQYLVDQLAERLQRSVSLDDQRRQYITSSRHFGDLDDLRVSVLLSRELNSEASSYLFSFVDSAQFDGPITVPENQALGISIRRCYPVQKDENCAGYLWLIGDATKAEDRLVAQTLPRLADALSQRAQSTVRQGSDTWNSLPQQLIRPDRRDIIQELWSHQTVDLRSEITVVASYTPDAGTESSILAQKLDNFIAKSQLDPRIIRLPAAAHGPIALTLLRFPSDHPPQKMPLSFADAPQEHGTTSLAVGHSDWGKLGDVEELLTQATLAAYTAFEWGRPVVPWSDSNYFGLLLKATLENPTGVIPPQITQLRTTGAGADLIKTAATFLQEGGDVSRTYNRLRIHRTTLYYRLARIEELTGYDLKNGNDRLALHIGTTLTEFLETGLPAFLHSEED